MNYASVCSGVEAASLAWHSLGWNPVWFSEIEPFPAAVLQTRFPNVPNLGDMTKIEGEKYRGTVDLLVGGTPCQGFSVAGKQGGLDDPRSALCLKYIDLLKTMRPRWFVWENVPGVFSTNGGSDFARFISEIENIGYGVAWRVLDAQYVRTYQFPHAVPQRRRRVFVVGYFGDWRPAAEVLFEPTGLLGNPPPRRIKGQRAAGGFETGAGKSILSDIAGTLDCRCKDGPIRNQNGTGVICSTVIRMRAGCEGGGKGALIGNERSHTLATNNDQTLVCYGIDNGQAAEASIMTEEISQTLNCMHDQQSVLCYENHPADSRIKDCGDTCPTIPSRAGTGGGNLPLVQTFPIDLRNGQRDADKKDSVNRQGIGVGKDGDPANTLSAVTCHGVAYNSTVRRLTPLECERLMGFPDNWTRIPWGKKPPEDCPDSPRYKACGNSMCVNVMQWIGTRIQRVENIITEASK